MIYRSDLKKKQQKIGAEHLGNPGPSSSSKTKNSFHFLFRSFKGKHWPVQGFQLRFLLLFFFWRISSGRVRSASAGVPVNWATNGERRRRATRGCW